MLLCGVLRVLPVVFTPRRQASGGLRTGHPGHFALLPPRRLWSVLHYPYSFAGSAALTVITRTQMRRRGPAQPGDTPPNQSAATARRKLMLLWRVSRRALRDPGSGP